MVSRPARAVVHLFFVSLFVALIAIQALKDIAWAASSGRPDCDRSEPRRARGGLLLRERERAAPSVGLTVLSSAPVLFLAVFLFFSPVSDLTFASGHGRDRRRQLACSRRHGRVRRGLHDRVRGRPRAGRPGALPEPGTPSKDATWFRYATAPTDMTGTATPTILTGTLAERYHPPILSSYPHNLFTLLGRRYRMKVSQEATDLCPHDLCEDASGESAAARDRALATDLGLVYLHVIAPDGIEHRPALGLRHGGQLRGRHRLDQDGGLARAPRSCRSAARAGGGRPARFASSSVDRPTRAADAVLQALAAAARPVEYLPDGHAIEGAVRSDPREHRRALVGKRRGCSKQAYQRHAAGRLSPTDCSARCWAGYTKRASTIARWSSSRPTTAKASSTVGRTVTSPTAADRRGHRLDAVADQAPRTAGTAATPTCTCARSTCCLRSPTRSTSGIPLAGRRLVGLRPLARASPPTSTCSCARAAGSRLSPAGVQAAGPGFARPEDQSVRRAWRVCRACSGSAPIRSRSGGRSGSIPHAPFSADIDDAAGTPRSSCAPTSCPPS